MASIISAGTTSATALNMSADTTGVLQLASNNGTVAVTVDTSQNVGIGTSSPQKALNVVASSSSTTIGSSTAVIQVGNSSGAALGLTAGIELFGSGSPSSGLGNRSASIYGLYEAFNGSGNAGALVFATNPAGTATVVERARIDSTGNVLVGTTTNSTFSKVGTIATSGVVNGFGVNCTTTASTGALAFFNPNGQVGSISVSGSATAYVTFSDYRLKNSIAPMSGALAKVALLKPCTYKWNVDGSIGQGFIAHELDEVVSGCVTGEKDAVDAEGKPKYQGIDTSFLVATLTAAIQEQQALIAQLQADVATLKGAA